MAKRKPMKKPMKKLGKIGKQNIKSTIRLKAEYQKRGITTCELCGSDFGLSFHHRYQRYYYIDKPELLGDFNQSLLLCIPCHKKLHEDKELNKETFNKLR